MKAHTSRSTSRPGLFAIVSALAVTLALLVTLPARGQIVINEFLADNQTNAVLADFPDYFPDYIELHNASDSPVDLGGWRVADSTTNYAFTAGLIIPPRGFLVVYCDSDTAATNVIHTGFGLSGTQGDAVALYRNGVLVESNYFGIQAPDFSVGRVADGTGAFQLTLPTPGTNNVAATMGNPLNLRLNEWQALGIGSGRSTNDWIELFNTDTNPVALAGLVLTDDAGKAKTPSDLNDTANFARKRLKDYSYIAPQGFVVIYLPRTANDADELDYFSISSTSGDRIWLYAADRTTMIDNVTSTNNVANKTEGRLPDGGDFPNTNNIAFKLPNSSRGDSNFGPIPEVVINEFLAHVDPPLEDAIELYNPTSTNVNIGGWWLSNNRNNPKKYQIPAGTIIESGGFKMFYEFQFNNTNTAVEPFNLNSARGGEIYLFKANAAGDLLGFRRGVDFGASQNGISFGRWINSQTNVDIVPMATLTFGSDIDRDDLPTFGNVAAFRAGAGAPNNYPKVGPVVINEIHYHPPDIISGAEILDNSLDEYIELYNTSSQSVPLYDPINYVYQGDNYANGRTNTWRLRGGISFDFPTNDVSMPANSFLLVVNFDPSDSTVVRDFTNRFNIPGYPSTVQIFGPYKGKLGNGGATVELRKPDAPQGPPLHDDERGFVPYLYADSVKYNDKAPWSLTADGQGYSLQRRVALDYGNDPLNWKGDPTSPGRPNSTRSLTAPSVTLNPANTTGATGGEALFSVAASGQELSYRWLFNGVQIAGATNATLQLTSLTTNMAGSYRALVQNPAGGVYSSAATLTVLQDITDTTAPTISINRPGSNIRVTNAIFEVEGTARDNTALAYVEVKLNDGDFALATGTRVWSKELTLLPGTNVITARSTDIVTNRSATITRTITYVVLDTLNLSTNGQGSVSGAFSTTRLELGRNYTLVAKPAANYVFSNWTGDVSSDSPTLTFTMAEDLDIAANFVPNPFVAVAGTYNGLFHEENNVRPYSAGSFTIKLTSKGTYTGQLLLAGKKYPFKGAVGLTGLSTSTVLRPGLPTLTLSWQFGLDGSDTLGGTITDGSWVAAVTGDRLTYHATLNPCPHAGRYTFVVPGAPGSLDAPEGDSVGTLLISTAGQVTIAGTLAENIKFTQKTAISKNGDIPLYVAPYGGLGLLAGWVERVDQPTADLTGDVTWIKPSNTGSILYPDGFTIASTLTGSTYTAPASTSRILNLVNGLFTLTGGDLDTPLTNAFSLAPGSKITNNGVHKITLTFVPATGLFSGTLTPTNTTTALKFSGAVLQSATNASGFLIGTNRIGRAAIEVAP